MPFQKGPCDEGGRMRGFLLPLLEEAAVVVLVLLLIFFFFFWSPLFSQHQSKQKILKQNGPVEERGAICKWKEKWQRIDGKLFSILVSPLISDIEKTKVESHHRSLGIKNLYPPRRRHRK